MLARWLLPPLCCLALALASLAVDDETGAELLLDLRDAVHTREQRVEGLEQQRVALIEHVRGLRSDPVEVEAVAREKLGMVRPGEIVIRFDPDRDRSGEPEPPKR